jgi:hypothetical protein
MYVPYPPPQPAYYYGPRYSGCFRFFLYAVSFFIPVAGLIIGLIFMARPDPESKGLGRTCLIIGVISIVLSCCATIVALLPGFLLPFLESQGYTL